jgi:hypothetical protein
VLQSPPVRTLQIECARLQAYSSGDTSQVDRELTVVSGGVHLRST